MSEALPQILKAKTPLTLSSVPSGYLPWLATDLARAVSGKGGRAIVIASDEAAMRAITDTAPGFAPPLYIPARAAPCAPSTKRLACRKI